MKARGPVALALATLSALAVPPALSAQKPLTPTDVAKLVAEADKLAADGKFLDARQRYALAVEQDPTNASVALKLARTCEGLRDRECAAGAYGTAARVSQGTQRRVAYGRFPIKWDGPNYPVQLLWVVDAAARGQIFVSGRNRDTKALLRFTKFGDTLGERQARFTLDPLGYKPKQTPPEELKKYGFDLIYAWFPEPGCYEIQARVGRQHTTLYLEIPRPSGK